MLFLSNPPQSTDGFRSANFGNGNHSSGLLVKESREILFLMHTINMTKATVDAHHDIATKVLIFSALTYMSEKEIASTSFTSVIDAFW